MKTHIHKYAYKNLTRNPKKEPYHVYICTEPNCTHHIRADLIDGKESKCNRCGQIFIIEYRKINRGPSSNTPYTVKPKCDGCIDRRNVKKIKQLDDIDKLMSDLLPEGLK